MRGGAGLAVAGLLAATHAAAEDVTQTALAVPSGQVVYWQDVVHTAPGTYGLTYRFRFIAPHLTDLLPPPVQPPGSTASDEDMAILDDPVTWQIGLADAPEGGGTAPAPAANPVPIARNMPTLGLPALSDAQDGAADPDLLALQDDMAWLCANYALPRIASPAPRPVQIVISISDRATLFGAVNPEMTQVFEAYDLPRDRNSCEWEAI